MSRNESDLREPRAPEGPEMIAAMRRGVVDSLHDHKRGGRPVVTWDRAAGRIIEVPPGGIVIPDESNGAEEISSRSDQ